MHFIWCVLCVYRTRTRTDNHAKYVLCSFIPAQGNEARYEDEAKQIRCLNAHSLRCCPYNQRTVLIVCAKYWQVRVSSASIYVWDVYILLMECSTIQLANVPPPCTLTLHVHHPSVQQLFFHHVRHMYLFACNAAVRSFIFVYNSYVFFLTSLRQKLFHCNTALSVLRLNFSFCRFANVIRVYAYVFP